jgi:hypothetical protein
VPVLEALEKAARTFGQSAGTAEKLRGLGLDARTECGDAFGRQVQREVQANSQLAKELDLKLE